MATQRVQLPDVEKLTERVIRILGGNPGKFTLQGTNTYLVGSGPKRVLIDTGEGKPAWISTVQKVLADEKASVESVILTHWHPDHVGGIKDILQLTPKPTIYKNSPSDGQRHIENGQKFEVEGATLRAFHCPGHTTDHMALVLEEEDALFTGDNVLGHGTAVFEDLPIYLKSLAAMGKEVNGKGYPGHGAVIDDCKAKISEYISHRETREKEVIEVLGRGTEGEGLDSMDLVRIIYQDVPENLHFAASRGVVQILEKLAGEGKVHFHDDANTWSLNRKAVL
ncbi:metallo-beta-lactamase superfamily protein [Tothia fuscella]|uniref:Metallo-beta-lactamase superfamily protein n=1 Tax=Tothia fuscella TaxID=1048955 RepID=A0A9P4U0M2_9PEZI|nr:metallo-beta-lactamase superfamily protein [Tothia fuscella]